MEAVFRINLPQKSGIFSVWQAFSKEIGRKRGEREEAEKAKDIRGLCLLCQVTCQLKADKQEKQGAFHSQHFKYKTKVQSWIAGKPLRSFKQPFPVSPGDEGKSVSEKKGA